MKKHKIEKWWREMCVKKGFDVEKRAEKGRWNLLLHKLTIIVEQLHFGYIYINYKYRSTRKRPLCQPAQPLPSCSVANVFNSVLLRKRNSYYLH